MVIVVFHATQKAQKLFGDDCRRCKKCGRQGNASGEGAALLLMHVSRCCSISPLACQSAHLHLPTCMSVHLHVSPLACQSVLQHFFTSRCAARGAAHQSAIPGPWWTTASASRGALPSRMANARLRGQSTTQPPLMVSSLCRCPSETPASAGLPRALRSA